MRTIALTLMLVAAIGAANAQSLKSQIEANAAKIGTAMMKKDTEGLAKLFKSGMTKDFKYVENAKGKPQTADQMIANMKMGINSMKKVTKAHGKVLSVKENGNTATVMMEHVMEGIMDMGDKKVHTMGFGGTSEDTYVKVNGKWLMSKMMWKSQKATMDGKPMSGMGG